MPTVSLTARAYNDLRVRAALAAHRATAPRNGNPGKGPSREGAGRGIQGPENSTSGTCINTGDSIRVSVTGRRRGGRPRKYATPAASNRARQRAYRARQLALLTDLQPENGGRP